MMIKFSEILVNKPISKKEIMEYFLTNGDEQIFSFSSIDDYKEEYGGELGEVEEKYITAYFRIFKPGEVVISYLGEGHGSKNIDLPNSYKYCWVGREEYGDGIDLVFHNVPNL